MSVCTLGHSVYSHLSIMKITIKILLYKLLYNTCICWFVIHSRNSTLFSCKFKFLVLYHIFYSTGECYTMFIIWSNEYIPKHNWHSCSCNCQLKSTWMSIEKYLHWPIHVIDYSALASVLKKRLLSCDSFFVHMPLNIVIDVYLTIKWWSLIHHNVFMKIHVGNWRLLF